MATTSERTAKRRRITVSPLADVPHDLLVSRVFVRLPVRTLIRVKSVCRAWRDAIDDPAFVRRHLELSRRGRPPSLLVIPRVDDPDDDSVSEDVSFHRLVLDPARRPGTADVVLMFEKALPPGQLCMTNAVRPTHCDGLVALGTATDRIFVCNPATREFVALPPGTHDVRGGVAATVGEVALGYDAWRKRYVVARYFYREYVECQDAATGEKFLDFDIGHEIFTLGGDVISDSACWVATDDPPHAIGPASPICTRNNFYWCTDHLHPNALLRFGLRDRGFDVVPCPPGMKFHPSVDNVTELSGKLCYVHTATKTAFDVWLADDDDAGPRPPQWSLRCRVDFDLYCESVGAEALLPVAAAGNEMLIAADYRTLYSYDARRQSVAEVVDMEDELAYDTADGSNPPYSGDLVHHVVPYVESLVPISKQMAGGV